MKENYIFVFIKVNIRQAVVYNNLVVWLHFCIVMKEVTERAYLISLFLIKGLQQIEDASLITCFK